MDLPKIRTFLEAAECLNFTETAARLHMAQPNISKQIAFLEDDLGVKLFYRTKGKLSLTPSGRALYQEYSKAMVHIEQGRLLAKQYAKNKTGLLRIGIFRGFDPSVALNGFADQFIEQWPEAEIQIELGEVSELKAGLNDNSLDLGIMKEFHILNDPHKRYLPISRGCPVLLTSSRHPLAQEESPSLETLDQYDYVTISPERSKGGYDFFLNHCSQLGFTPRITNLVSNLDTLFYYVEKGAVAIIDQCYHRYGSSTFHTIPLPISSANNVLVWLEGSTNPLLEIFLDFIRAQINKGDA